MSEEPLVNGQVIDAVTGMVTLMSGQSPSQSFGILDTVMADTLGMAMYNAVNRQQNSSLVGNAAITAACAKMLAVPFPIIPPPPPPPAGTPPAVNPLPGPIQPLPPSAAEAAAAAQGNAAIAALQQIAQSSGSDAATATQALAALARQAAAPVPTPAPTPTATPSPAPTPAPTPVP